MERTWIFHCRLQLSGQITLCQLLVMNKSEILLDWLGFNGFNKEKWGFNMISPTNMRFNG